MKRTLNVERLRKMVAPDSLEEVLLGMEKRAELKAYRFLGAVVELELTKETELAFLLRDDEI